MSADERPASANSASSPAPASRTTPKEGSDSTLGARLRERIRLGGALTFREWMSAALYDEREGYYRRRGAARWGRAGDYRTSPERSALFAATFARRFAEVFDELGGPPTLHLLEAGGGAGHFARGVLQTLQRDAPQVFSSLRYIFDESSEDSRGSAATLLAPFADRVEFRSLRNINGTFDALIVFSNELLDAFPVNRVVMRGGELRELYVGLDGDGNFVWLEGQPSTPRLGEYFGRMKVTLSEGQFAEVSLGAEEWFARVGELFGRGYVFTVDYGEEAAALFDPARRREGTLRAFRGHEFAEDVLSSPGEQDLTTTVNWTHAVSVGERAGLRAVGLVGLDKFLLANGLLEQLERESACAASEAEVASLRLGAREMILPGGMSARFQLLIQRKP
ncbi:MAG TPA: SAM-dependent methyltransferase [Pyrinomonadaceae bacterium]|jgi:SAM-dependent MidA family methyltransferase|nr:SAM-dependent methyltransferase [Pyrinomonadaceae bacterium]